VPDAASVPDNEHPDHQLRIDRWAADVAVKRLQMQMHIGEHVGQKDIHPSQQVVPRNHLVEVELIKQLPLVPVLWPIISESPADLDQQESVFAASFEHFFDSIGPTLPT